jgi:hypothetical protein
VQKLDFTMEGVTVRASIILTSFSLAATYIFFAIGAAALAQDAPQKSQGLSFHILVDTNQLEVDEASHANLFAADGVWAIPENSPAGINWPTTLQTLNAEKWTVSEDNPSQTSQVDFVSQSIHRMVDAAMFYIEDGVATPLSDSMINSYAAHIVPGHGKLGSRIVVLTRSYADGDPRQAELNHALLNRNVSGAAFEFNPDGFVPPLNFAAGCAHILSLNKKCYLLMPPQPYAGNYLGGIQWMTAYFAQNGLLDNPNVYFVLATYVRPNAQHYLSTGSADPDSIEVAVQWLRDYRAGLVTAPAYTPDEGRPPQGWLDAANCNVVSGWTYDPDTPPLSNFVDFYVDDTLAGYTNADTDRSDLCSWTGSCYHGFTWAVPSQYFDGNVHTLYAFGIDTTILNTNNLQLSGSPMTFQCAAP